MPIRFFALLSLLCQFAGATAMASAYVGEDFDAPPAAKAKAEESAPAPGFKYVTKQEILLKGIVLPGEGDAGQALPQEILMGAETVFHIDDRTDDGEGNRFVKIRIESGDEFGSMLTYWVNEGELVNSLYELKSENPQELSLDKADPRDARFVYGAAYAVAGPVEFMMPVRGARRSSPPGMRKHPISRKRKMHAGWDLAAPIGTPVMAAADGVVEKAGRSGGYGNLIILKHGRLQTRYGHLSKILVKKGQAVKLGQVIGKVGSTGYSTGPHLHFEQRAASGAIIFSRPKEMPANIGVALDQAKPAVVVAEKKTEKTLEVKKRPEVVAKAKTPAKKKKKRAVRKKKENYSDPYSNRGFSG